MAAQNTTQQKGIKARYSRLHNALGFKKSYNFVMWFTFAGALLGFSLARLMYLNFSKHLCPNEVNRAGNSAAPGECYYYKNFMQYKVGILLHLAGVLPASILACLQFTPVIRHKAILAHRIMGYIALLLVTTGIVGAFMIARHSFGGGLAIQANIGFFGIAVMICFILAYVNIKRLQIEQHRAWMLRGWGGAGAIITSRLIMIISATIISGKGYYAVWPCAKIASTTANEWPLLEKYPACEAWVNGTNPDQVAIVEADMGGGSAATAGAALNVCFGMSLWVAVAIHVILVELYLHLTPKEAQRLRQVSYQRQLEAGMKNPGSAGLTADRFGDADKFVPDVTKDRKTSDSSIGSSAEVFNGNDDVSKA